MLGCCSPQVAAKGLVFALTRLELDPAEMTLLDLGADTGIVGELLRGLGVGNVVGLDALRRLARSVCETGPGSTAGTWWAISRIRRSSCSGSRAITTSPVWSQRAPSARTHVPATALVQAIGLLPPALRWCSRSTSAGSGSTAPAAFARRWPSCRRPAGCGRWSGHVPAPSHHRRRADPLRAAHRCDRLRGAARAPLDAAGQGEGSYRCDELRTSVSSPLARGIESVRVPLPTGLQPEQAVLWLREDERPFALVGDWLGGVAVLGSDPASVASPGTDPFSVMESRAASSDGEAVIGGGWVGWLGYGLGAQIERLPPSPPAPVPRPPFSLAFYDHVVLFDGDRWWFEALWSEEREAALHERMAVWNARLQAKPQPARDVSLSPFALARNGAEGHVSAVADCLERIAAGELYQANLCLRLEARWDGDLVDLFARALPLAKPRFGALVDGVVSLSPERFLRRTGRWVQAEPIKGTRGRTGAEEQRRASFDELVASSKDAAEHVMIVDLMRNDLGRVCEYGTVTAEPPRVEPHAGVWHMVSTVSGRLRDDVGDGALMRATFPPGSVTGAPKVQAMKVIAALEATRRELYTGAIGIVSPIAGLDLSVAIRTFETRGSNIWFGAGGGIVADSDPELELAEALTKASGPIAAIGGRLVEPVRHRTRARHIGQPALVHRSRPDPASGVFETVLVEDGKPVRLEQHIDRLAASVAELYGARPDSGIAVRARKIAATAGVNRSRLRILFAPDGSVRVTISPAGAAFETPLTLMPFAMPGGLGSHKWRDRSLLTALGAQAPGTVPLIVDTDGLVLEAAHANIWIVEQGRLFTPPTDGRILAGITRAALLADEPSAREAQIDLTRLEHADAIFLTSSISGRHPARLR
jgi:para-aminobenzoate synthetase / 4-amino-4-deoxychorismate lyase